ncbi:hypothetical protein F2P56_019261, partial [Juglans regia]
MEVIWNHDVLEYWVKPAMSMVVVQLLVAGVNVFYKLAAYDGMSLRVIVAYRFSFAAAFIVPIALLVERLERLGLGTTAGKAKVLGTLIGIGGAMLLTFYEGPEINIWLTNVNLLRHDNSQLHQSRGHSTTLEPENRLLGCILALGSCLSYATWLMVQAKMMEKYPCHYSSTALMCVMGAIQSVVFALCMERDWSQWKLGWNIRLLTVAYSGIFGSGVVVTLLTWCLHMRGPLYVSSFNPLMPVSVAILGSLLLDEKLHLGRKSRPKLTRMVLFQSFLCGLFGGSLYHNLYIESLALTSATFASAMTNLVPAITFILAVSFGYL